MELKPGYKQTEVGLIPKEWDAVTLKQIVEGNRLPSGIYKAKGLYGRGKRIIKVCDVFGYDYFVPDLAQKVELSDAEISNYRVRQGDIIIALASVKLEGVGKVLLVDRLNEDTAYDHNVALIRLINKVDQRYVFHLFKSDLVRKQVVSRATQVGTTFLKTSTILEFPLPLPATRAEQETIADALSDVDALLAGLDRLIAKKRDVKQAAMQQLLTGQTRLPGFHGEWEEKTLGQLFHLTGGYSASREQLSSKGYCYLHYGDIHKSSKSFVDVRAEYQDIPKLDISLKKVSSTSLLKDGDVVFVDASEDDEGTSRHVVVLNDASVPFIAGLHTIVAKPKSRELAHEYQRYCFQTSAVRQQFLFYAVGTKVSGISKANIAKLTLLVPGISEQNAIAEVLTDMDTEIAALEQRREKTRALKQAMMQELLTGKTRLI
jgi:type I restriction enzyme S subunit